MDVRSPFFQNIAAILAGVMFLNPIVSAAAELTAAAGSGVTIGQAGNGVPVVNIAAPNGNGLSHNKFKDYNVGQQGLILNNATTATQSTQLGGIILGNSKLNGKAAGMILNEVTGSNASRLQGYTEVAGKSAHVIVANPHGISCDGCGFINTPRVTLSTGTPVIENGRLDRFDVNGGQIAIEGQGLNASNIDQFDLITRSAKINAELHANKLNVIAGRNVVKADDLSVIAKTPDGSDKPLLAIDSSALGGMYAGAIRLVGTEAGVGVKLAGDMAASAGDIQIDASGRLSMGRSAAARDLQIAAQQVELNGDAYAAGSARISAQENLINRQSLATGGSGVLRAGELTNEGVVEAGVKADNSRSASADLTLAAETIRNSGTLIAGRTLAATASQTLDNQGGTLSAGTTRIDTVLLNNQQGRVLGTINSPSRDRCRSSSQRRTQ
ncbi:filamentous hemagglutinin N-terminal domain-containing protein, partial [Stutzerimonas frequens]|uniref:filamentous hemagglutinin N-terminal domain-containing protein n=1 Tax=Stutzerimonas frequens TaxID=2968969 RepID=UPI004037B9D1